MIISGFQALSLIDYPGVIAATVFTQGCPFRCGYCHNPDLIPTRAATEADAIQEGEILAFLERRKGFIEGVCVTGGEPTVQPGLPDFLRSVKRLGYLVKLDTNGLNPGVVRDLVTRRLVDFIAMDLKHIWERYGEVIGLDGRAVENCRETFRLIQDGPVRHEFRTTVSPALHRPDDLRAIAAQLKEGQAYALQAVRYEKTLDPAFPRAEAFDLGAVADEMRRERPGLRVEVRA